MLYAIQNKEGKYLINITYLMWSDNIEYASCYHSLQTAKAAQTKVVLGYIGEYYYNRKYNKPSTIPSEDIIPSIVEVKVNAGNTISTIDECKKRLRKTIQDKELAENLNLIDI